MCTLSLVLFCSAGISLSSATTVPDATATDTSAETALLVLAKLRFNQDIWPAEKNLFRGPLTEKQAPAEAYHRFAPSPLSNSAVGS
jgi:hypothetical protein